MTEMEALMWRLGGHDPRLRSTMSLVVWFDRELDRGVLRERVGEVSRSVPLLRRRVATGPLGVVPPRWEPDPAFALDHHLQVARAGHPVEAEAVARDVIGSPFTPHRPPWRVVLVPGPPDALVMHLHHSYTDGLGGVRLLAELFDLSEAGRERDGTAPPADPLPGPGGGPGPQEELQDEMSRSLRLLGRAVPWAARSVLAASTRPDQVLQTASELLGALRTHLSAAAGPSSPVLRPRSGGVALGAVDLPLEALRGAGRTLGATVNDVFLGGLLEGLARYHEKCAVLPPSLRLGIPISARPAGGDDLGMHNQLYGAVLRGPLGPLDFDERTRLVHEMVRHARHQPWAGWLEDAAGLAARVPGAVGLVAAALGSLDVLASNVTGPPFPLYLGGALVERMVPIGPRSGSALNVTLLSYRDRAHLGLNIDPVSVADPEVLVDCIRAAFDEHLPGPG